jgi:hypothetical protein
MQKNTVEIPVGLAQAIERYLLSRPMGEVEQIVGALRAAINGGMQNEANIDKNPGK